MLIKQRLESHYRMFFLVVDQASEIHSVLAHKSKEFKRSIFLTLFNDHRKTIKIKKTAETFFCQ